MVQAGGLLVTVTASLMVRGEDLKLWIELQLKVFEADFHRAAGMHLQADDAAAGDSGIVDIDAKNAIDGASHFGADGQHFVGIPLIGFNAAIPRFVPEEGATVFFVKLAPPTCANIG